MTARKFLSLYEDWKQRRAQLHAQGAPRGRSYANAAIRVLDYLLSRYRGSPAANAIPSSPPLESPAQRSPPLKKYAWFDHGSRAGVRNEEEARLRASKILQRISAQNPQESCRRFLERHDDRFEGLPCF